MNIYNSDGTLTGNRTVTQADKNLTFTATGTNAFSVDGSTLSVDAANNRLGIGTIAPTRKLDVQGSQLLNAAVTAVDTKNALDINIGQDGSTFGNRSENFGINIKTSSSNNTGSIARINFGDAATTNNSGTRYLSFSVGKTPNELMYLTDANNGRVGIGTTVPSTKLDVQGTGLFNAAANGGAVKNALDINVGQDGSTYGNRSDNYGINMKTSSSNNAGSIARINFGDAATTNNSGTRYLSFSVGKTPNELMYLTDANSGRVGIGTTTPTARLELVSDNAGGAGQNDLTFHGYGTSKNPTMSIGSANGTAAAPTDLTNGDTIGGLYFSPRYTGDFIYHSAGMRSTYRGASGADALSDLTFRTSSKDRVTIDENGNVGIGTTSPTQKLHVLGNILASGTITPSDIRIKKDITDNTYGLKEILGLRTIGYKYKDENLSKDHKIGFVAQEVKAAMPELVSTADDKIKTLGVNYAEMTVVLAKAVQEQQTQIDELKLEVTKLKAGKK
ncbi:hypothetical protein A0O34_02405 [Chryseobacterium glaciei]|uniref:Peptidase S74 domain-containing protein n=1 Tax=Chryseobacterium glaciei TaxID=1685010 RepID=A0A172XRL7_9FLAO|nr:tail fiber domain-containing protein [Chryseobacterium glaciei]ANF49472.1 hypothetical protein A0O34_02405 [Chryseobacterium glaciei]